MAILYPVAKSAEAALEAPLGRAAREREAKAAAGADVVFVSEAVGPEFETREEAQAWVERIASQAPEERYLMVREMLAPVRGRPARAEPVEPVNRDGRRWPKPGKPPKTFWRVSISYWRVVDPAPQLAPARKARRDPAAGALGREALDQLARQPLKPVAPQQPLDIGLFEVRAPEDPGRVLPDE